MMHEMNCTFGTFLDGGLIIAPTIEPVIEPIIGVMT
jgi:hypothetical protein